MNVVAFPDRGLVDAQSNFDKVVDRARRSRIFSDAIEFGAPVWDLAPVKPARASAGSAKQAKLYFTTHEGGTKKGLVGRIPLAVKFADFVKAIIVLREEIQDQGGTRPRPAAAGGAVPV